MSNRTRSIPTTVPLPPELRARVERVRDAMRVQFSEVSLNDAIRRVVQLGLERAEHDSQPPSAA